MGKISLSITFNAREREVLLHVMIPLTVYLS